MNEELDYTADAALALEEEWDTFAEDNVDGVDATDGDVYEDIEDDEEGDLFDILERAGY